MSPLAPACQRSCQISQCSGRPHNVARIHRAMAPEVGYVAFLKGAEPRRSLAHHNLCTARTVTIPGLACPGDAFCKRAHTFISLRDQTHARRGMHGSTGMHGEEQSASEMYRSMRGQRAGRSWPTACLALLGWSRSVRCAARRADGASSPRLMVAAFGSLARQGGGCLRAEACQIIKSHSLRETTSFRCELQERDRSVALSPARVPCRAVGAVETVRFLGWGLIGGAAGA